MKKVTGFTEKRVQYLKPNEFFFFPNGRKRMVCESKKTGINHTEIIATSPTGRTYKKEVLNDKYITVYE